MRASIFGQTTPEDEHVVVAVATRATNTSGSGFVKTLGTFRAMTWLWSRYDRPHVMSDLTVRRLAPDAIEDLARLIEHVCPGSRAVTPEHAAHLRSALASADCYVFGAFDAGVPVGYVSAYRFPRLDRPGDQVYIFDIEVLPRSRRRGVGRALADALLAACWADGVSWAWAGTAGDNAAAQRLFASVGGTRVGETYVEYHFVSPGEAEEP